MNPTAEQAAAYAAGQYDVSHTNSPGCVYFGGDGAWHHDHYHDTWGDAEACRDRARARCAARVQANGHTEL